MKLCNIHDLNFLPKHKNFHARSSYPYVRINRQGDVQFNVKFCSEYIKHYKHFNIAYNDVNNYWYIQFTNVPFDVSYHMNPPDKRGHRRTRINLNDSIATLFQGKSSIGLLANRTEVLPNEDFMVELIIDRGAQCID